MNAPVNLQVNDLSIHFGGHVAVDSVTSTFKQGELTVVVGPNGAGKTTLFNLISGQLMASSGRITLAGKRLNGLSPSARAKMGIGRAFQLTNLFPRLSVLENVRLAVQAQAGIGMRMFRAVKSYKKIEDKAFDFLAQTKLTDMADLPVLALSHGDQRKLEVALLLAMQPKVFMFDEPTAGMSVDEAPTILELISDIKRDESKIVLLVEHKMDVVKALADRIIVLNNGKLVADGNPEQVIASPVVREIYLGTSA